MARLEPLHYYKWLWRDWRSNRRVQRMHYIARGFYRELLDEQFIEGSIPNNIDALADICGCPRAVMQEYWPEIAPHFEQDENGCLVHPKMETVRTEMDAIRVKQSNAGRKSAESKLKNTQGNSTDVQLSLTGVENFQPAEQSRAETEQSKGPPSLPEWISRESWDGYEEMRRKIRKPMTDRARSLALTELAKLRDNGSDPTAVLNQSTLNSWQGLFELKTSGNGTKQWNAAPTKILTLAEKRRMVQ